MPMFQPDYTDCDNCGTVDHNDYSCPCECHGPDAVSKHTAKQQRLVALLNAALSASCVYMNERQMARATKAMEDIKD